ncbi:hypothetical protein MTR67_028182 [Solanum verrucosum]|uniref:Uncharacterized protein n=1 Tax=Solanum verrucosum TaxID=315347 RepID=A0AAF0R212_SOLVR|nr:hypothetical protein MTR67_028182 [Solanum verrucosum]
MREERERTRVASEIRQERGFCRSFFFNFQHRILMEEASATTDEVNDCPNFNLGISQVSGEQNKEERMHVHCKENRG